MGQKVLPTGEVKKHKSDLGYEYEATIYQAIRCNGCPLNGPVINKKETEK